MIAVMSLIGQAHLDSIKAASQKVPPGDFIEIGVYRGGSAMFLAEVARTQNRKLWLFDSFCGILERTEGLDAHQVGDFGDGDLETVRHLLPDATIVVGDVRVTLPATDLPPIAFAHIDVDQYASTKACIERISPCMVAGGLMWFDDYGCLEGANRAVNEFYADRLEWSGGSAGAGKAFVRF